MKDDEKETISFCTNLQIYERIESLAKKNGLSTDDCINYLLSFALSQEYQDQFEADESLQN